MEEFRRPFSSEALTVRRMVESDASVIHDIHSACLTVTFSGRYTEAQISAWMRGRTAAGYLRAAQEGEGFLVGCVGDMVVGYVSWQDGELRSLFVRPDLQAAGIGSCLLRKCCEEAIRESKPISRVKAAVGAEPFYRRHGFEPTGRGSTIKHGVEIQDTRMVRHPPQRPLDQPN